MRPILLDLGAFKLATYGVLVAAGYLLGILWLRSEQKRMGLDDGKFWLLIYLLFFGAIVGGKLLFAVMNWDAYASGEMRLFRDFRYGFVFWGGFLGAVAMGLVFVRLHKYPYLRGADYFGVALPMGHALGRLGCLAAGCCYGRPSRMPWAVRFTDARCLVEDHLLGVPLHPTQVYESLGDVVIVFILMKVLRRTQRGMVRQGTAFYGFFLLYAALRFAIEFYRGDDRGGLWLGLSPSQWIAIACVAVVGPLLWRNGVWARAPRRT